MVVKGLKNLFTNQVVPASGTVTSANAVYTGDLKKLDIWVSNTGASTTCTISIMRSPDSAMTMEGCIMPFTLGANGKECISVDKDSIPRWIWAKIVNGDTTNSATVTVTLDSPEWEIVSPEWNP